MTVVYFDTAATFAGAVVVKENYAIAARKLAEAKAGALVLRLTLPNGKRVAFNVDHIVGVSES